MEQSKRERSVQKAKLDTITRAIISRYEEELEKVNWTIQAPPLSDSFTVRHLIRFASTYITRVRCLVPCMSSSIFSCVLN